MKVPSIVTQNQLSSTWATWATVEKKLISLYTLLFTMRHLSSVDTGTWFSAWPFHPYTCACGGVPAIMVVRFYLMCTTLSRDVNNHASQEERWKKEEREEERWWAVHLLSVISTNACSAVALNRNEKYARYNGYWYYTLVQEMVEVSCLWRRCTRGVLKRCTVSRRGWQRDRSMHGDHEHQKRSWEIRC